MKFNKFILIAISLITIYVHAYRFDQNNNRISVKYDGEKVILKPRSEALSGKLSSGKRIVVKCSKSINSKRGRVKPIWYLKELKAKNKKNFTGRYCAGNTCRNVNCEIKIK